MLYSASLLVPQIVGFAITASRDRFATRPKSSRKRSVRCRRLFRKAFVPLISPFRKKSVTCSASFLMSPICSNSSFLTLARRRRLNCRFLEEIRVKRAPLGIVARSFVSLTFSSTWFDYARHRETLINGPRYRRLRRLPLAPQELLLTRESSTSCLVSLPLVQDRLCSTNRCLCFSRRICV